MVLAQPSILRSKMMIKLPIFVLLWAGMIVIKGVTAFLGLFVVAILWKWRNTTFDEVPKWTTPWLNPEDWYGTVHHYEGSLPKWWVQLHGTKFRSFWHYHALRNSANGLRNIEWLDLDIVPDKVHYKTNYLLNTYEPNTMRELGKKTTWYLAWQRFQAGFKLVHIWNDERHLVIKIGWRVEPLDATKRDRPQVLIDDASFALKILIWRKG